MSFKSSIRLATAARGHSVHRHTPRHRMTSQSVFKLSARNPYSDMMLKNDLHLVAVLVDLIESWLK